MIRDSAVSNMSIGVFALFTHQYTVAWTSLLMAAYMFWVYEHRLVLRDKETEEEYLIRYHLIRTPWFRVFLHRIFRADKDRDVHSHPWPAFTFVLRGGYFETVTINRWWYGNTLEESYFRQALSFSCEAFRPDRFHRISLVMPNTWTLFFAGKRRNTNRGVSEWFFFKDGVRVPCREYLNLPDDFDFND